jgi:hypothetical protein
MVKIICEKTGIEFEAASKRTKNHPQIMVVVNEANRDGWYTQCLTALKAGREAGFTTLGEFIELLDETRKAAREQRDMQIGTFMDRKRAAQEARRQRFILNDFLRENGYHWSDLAMDPEDVDNSFTGHLPTHDWQLFSSDNRAVSVKQAMQELAAQDIKFAKEWLEERSK